MIYSKISFYFKTKYSLLDEHTQEVLKKASASTIVKASGMLLGLVVSIFLGRNLGAKGIGVLNLSIQIATIFMTFALLGVRQVVIKEVAIGYEKNDFTHIQNILFSAYLIVGLFTITLSIILFFSSEWISAKIFNNQQLFFPLSIAFLALTPQVFSILFSSALIGYRKIWQSNLADQTLSYLFIGLAMLFLVVVDIKVTVKNVAVVFALGRIFVLIIIGGYWKSINQREKITKFLGKKIRQTAYPLLLVSLAMIISSSTSIVVLGWLGDVKDIGIFSVSHRVSMLTSFFLLITNSAVSPKIAHLYFENKLSDLEKMVQRITKGLILIGFGALFFFIFFGKVVLGFWGTDFQNGYLILIILTAGQFFNIATGAGGILLMMTGNEKILRNISLSCLLGNILLNVLLIMNYGALGAAIAFPSMVVIENVLKVIYAKKYTQVLTIKL